MKKTNKEPVAIRTISDLHRLSQLPPPEHPLISVLHFKDLRYAPEDFKNGYVPNFYIIAVKKDFKGKIRYGQSYYDFDEGVMSFMSPGQLYYEERPDDRPCDGVMLMVHPDLFHNSPLAANIKKYRFFSYAVNEALCLSKKEEGVIENILANIEQEYRANIDGFSQNVMISQIELLLHYSDRYYHRQFLTRKTAGSDLLSQLEQELDEHFSNNPGLPTVKDIADKLHVSADYLSDMLRAHTGQNTQQHIHNKLIEKAKEILGGSNLSVAEIAYQLGFEHPQSFNKLFKRKTNITPKEFRQSLN